MGHGPGLNRRKAVKLIDLFCALEVAARDLNLLCRARLLVLVVVEVWGIGLGQPGLEVRLLHLGGHRKNKGG